MALSPGEIERESFRIIEGLLKDKDIPGPEKDVVMRVVHATADLDFADNMVFSRGAVEAGLAAVRSGRDIVTDVNMLAAGISSARQGGGVRCFISDPDVAERARAEGTTRAAAAMRKAAEGGYLDGAIAAVGNAPTALFELIRLVKSENVRPALIVGVPVGFVGAAESKEALLLVEEVPFITSRGRKGGSPAGAAVLNALTRLAG